MIIIIGTYYYVLATSENQVIMNDGFYYRIDIWRTFEHFIKYGRSFVPYEIQN